MSARVRRTLVFALVEATLPTAALAAEGAIEINQARALAGGVTTGDTPGFPVTISAPGRYVLTGGPTASGQDAVGIVIDSDDVTLDLNGFRIAGGTTCTGFGVTLTCTPKGGGIGVFSFQHEGLTLRNGTVTGFASNGIHLLRPRNCGIEGLTIAGNGEDGLSLQGGGCEISGVIVDRNGLAGILQSDDGSEPDTTVRESVISRNRRNGLDSDLVSGSNDRFAVLRGVVQGNGLSGVSLANQGTVRDCVIQGNVDIGVFLHEGYVRGSAVRSNDRGFSFGPGVGYIYNSFSEHVVPSSGGVPIGGRNRCDNNPTTGCP